MIDYKCNGVDGLIVRPGIDTEHFELKQSFFDCESYLHGISHTYRVMTLCLVLGCKTGYERDSLLAFCGAFIHDMARQHDGGCSKHGQWAVERKLDIHKEQFARVGIGENDLSIIKSIVTRHSLFGDSQEEKAEVPLSILKDADALDRIRLGERNLRPEFLRLSESHNLIDPARKFYEISTRESFCKLKQYIHAAADCFGP